MSKYYYDLHTHSALSPCADNDNTPNDLLGMASLSGIDILALTDHNTAKNCPAFFKAAEKYGIIPVAGVELTTSEDIHVVCLFPSLDSALSFDAELQTKRVLIENRADIFGEQILFDEEDRIIGYEKHLLPNGTTVSVEDAPSLVEKHGGVCYPAHIDRDANGIISVLGTFPVTPKFNAFEIRDREKKEEYVQRYSLADKICIVSSDAHYLTDIRDKENYFELSDGLSHDEIRAELIKLIRGEEKR